MFPNMNIISTTYYRVTTFIHIYPKIFVLRLFHENITVITMDVHVQSHGSIQIVIISFMSSTLSYARPLNQRQLCPGNSANRPVIK